MSKTLAFIRKELREMIPPTLFFLVVFQVLILVRSLLGSQGNFTMTTAAAALIGALVVGKSILIADALPLFRWYREPKLIYNIVWRMFLYLSVVLIFQILEELIPLVSKTGSLMAGVRSFFSEVNIPRFWATHLVLALFLTIWSFLTALIEIVGREKMLDSLFGRTG